MDYERLIRSRAVTMHGEYCDWLYVMVAL